MKPAIALLLALCLSLFAPSCASAPAVKQLAVEPFKDLLLAWDDARQDPIITPEEIRRVDDAMYDAGRGVAELEKVVDRSYPPLDQPSNPARWMEWGLTVLGIVGGGGFFGYRAKQAAKREVHEERDAQRVELGQPIVEGNKVELARRRRAPIGKPLGPVTTGPHTGA